MENPDGIPASSLYPFTDNTVNAYSAVSPVRAKEYGQKRIPSRDLKQKSGSIFLYDNEEDRSE
jgi:hypothetical protein